MSRSCVILEKGQIDLETKVTDCSALPTSKWDAEADDRLLACVASGTPEERQQAFDAFYRRHAEYLFGICYNLANRYRFGFFDAEDVFLSTMAKARERANTFKAEGIADHQELHDAVDAWLGGIAKNVVFGLLARTPKCISVDPHLIDGDDDDAKDQVGAPEHEAFPGDETEEMKLVREAIDTLSPKEQEVIWAMNQFYERREHQRTPTGELDQIIDALGISKDNFRQIKKRARAKISRYVINHKPIPEAQ